MRLKKAAKVSKVQFSINEEKWISKQSTAYTNGLQRIAVIGLSPNY